MERSSGEARTAVLRMFRLALLTAVLGIAGLIWLALVTEWPVLQAEWLIFILLLALHQLFARLDFASWLGAPEARVAGSYGRFLTWSAALVWGPVALWLDVIGSILTGVWRTQNIGPQNNGNRRRWQTGQQMTMVLARDTLPGLAALTLYQAWGGVWLATEMAIPVWGSLFWLAAYATLVRAGLVLLLMGLLFGVGEYGRYRSWLWRGPRLLRFSAVVFLFYLAPDILALLTAGIYVWVGPWVYVAAWGGLYLPALLAHVLIRTTVYHRRHAYRLTQLEQLARTMLRQPADAIDLSQLLATYVPLLFPHGWIEIRLLPDRVLFAQGNDWFPAPDAVWQQVSHSREPYWMGEGLPEAVAQGFGPEALVAPINASEEGIIGGIYLMCRPGDNVQDWIMPAQLLAGQIAAGLEREEQFQRALASQAAAYQEEVYEQAYQAEVYAQALAYERMSHELAAAGQIQATFLPQALPEVPGWQLTVALEPAYETSGDFYDIISLPNGRLGLVVADVAEKGMGAALYMALSRTLIRIYAAEYDGAPEEALAAANRRILADTSSDLFVTVFYAVLDPATGLLTYCNAGHNPPLLQPANGHPAQLLTRTALPLGLFDDRPWERGVAQMTPGDVLVIYTDGVTEAEDEGQQFFGEQRLQAVTRANIGRSAEVIESKITSAIYEFMGEASQMDDITLMVLVRE